MREIITELAKLIVGITMTFFWYQISVEASREMLPVAISATCFMSFATITQAVYMIIERKRILQRIK